MKLTSCSSAVIAGPQWSDAASPAGVNWEACKDAKNISYFFVISWS